MNYKGKSVLRSSGVLMHITSLPGPWGVGTMGRQAYSFVDFLKAAGQSYWQILPLTPTGYGDSPYQSCSAFAGNHYLIDLDLLIDEGLLTKEDLMAADWGQDENWVSFNLLYQHKLSVLKKAYERFTGGEAFDSFCLKNSAWLSDFALYMALKDQTQGKPWYEWEKPLKFRDPDAIWNVRRKLKESIRFYQFVQFLFFRQWDALHSYAHNQGIKIIGDVPIYVPLDSADVWRNPELFQLDQNLKPEMVAGVPPDGFTADGQLWGNPLYRWDKMEKADFSWWINRLEAAGTLYDVVRLDHFRGFEAYWAVPFGDKNARGGKWIKGPGMAFIQAIQKKLPKLSLIAEDLGFLTQEVLDLRDNSGYPGMKVLEFAFDSREPSDYLPYNYKANSVCYTGTHDNMTMRQWFDTAPADAVAYAREFMTLSEKEGLVWGVIRTAFSSVSDLAIVQMQDYLDLGAEARMNFPGTLSSDNWSWRMKPGAANSALAEKIRKLTVLYNRLGSQKHENAGQTAEKL